MEKLNMQTTDVVGAEHRKNRCFCVRRDFCTKNRLYIVQQSCRWGFLHFDVGEEFLASVLQTGTEEIHHIVDDQETVMIALRGVDVNRWILLVVTLQIQLLLLVQLTSVNGGCNARRAIAEHRQGIDIDIVVDEDDGVLRLFDEADDMCVGIEDLSVVEDAFHWR